MRRASSARSRGRVRQGRRTCCSTTTWARSTAPSEHGACRAAAPARWPYAIANSALSLGVEIRTEAGVDHVKTQGGRATGVVLSSGEEIDADVVMSSLGLAPDVHQPARRVRPGPDLPRRGHAFQVPGIVGQGEPCAVRPARAGVQAGRGPVAARRDQLLAVAGLHGARVRRREVRPPVRAPLHRLHHADIGRPHHGAARQARHELLRAVRPLSPGARSSSGTMRSARHSART